MDEEDVRAKSAEDAANATEKGIEEIEKTIKYLKNKRENLMQEKLQTCISNYEVDVDCAQDDHDDVIREFIKEKEEELDLKLEELEEEKEREETKIRDAFKQPSSEESMLIAKMKFLKTKVDQALSNVAQPNATPPKNVTPSTFMLHIKFQAKITS